MTMRERIEGAVSDRLAAAADSQRKTEVVEELTDNLYARYQELLAAGMDAEEAFEGAMDYLGEVNELIDLIGSRSEWAELESAVTGIGTRVREMVHGLKGPAEECVRSAKEAAKAAREDVENMVRSIGETMANMEITVEAESRHQFSYRVPADGITGLELRLQMGDAVIRLWDEADAIQVIERSSRTLDENTHAAFSRGEDGVLRVEQGNTAAGRMFFRFGLCDSDFEVFLPRRLWTSVTVQSTNGDLELGDGLEVERVLITTTNGDTDLGRGLRCGSLEVTSVSGDVEGEEADIRRVIFRATSGDLELGLTAMPEAVDAQTVSGDMALELPENEGFALRYQQMAGELKSDFELTTSVNQSMGVACYKGAAAPEYQFKAVSGDVRLRRG